MARKPRIEFEGAFYHIVTRGNQRQKIFKDKSDFLKYLEILTSYKNRYNYFLYAYVLMSNHIHLLVETQKNPLSKILQGINQSYTVYFNRKYKTVGHLFQGRYKAIICDKEEYLLSLIKYIHLNPLRAKVVKTLEEYQWSSHNGYIKKLATDKLIDTDQVLRMFSEDKTKARKLYRIYMGEPLEIKKDDVYCIVDQRVLGGEEFVEKVIEKSDGELRQGKRRKEYTLDQIANGIKKIYGVNTKQIREKSKSRDIAKGRKLLSLVAKEYGYTGKEIANYIRKDQAIVTRHLKEKSELKSEIDKVFNVLKKNKCQ